LKLLTILEEWLAISLAPLS